MSQRKFYFVHWKEESKPPIYAFFRLVLSFSHYLLVRWAWSWLPRLIIFVNIPHKSDVCWKTLQVINILFPTVSIKHTYYVNMIQIFSFNVFPFQQRAAFVSVSLSVLTNIWLTLQQILLHTRFVKCLTNFTFAYVRHLSKPFTRNLAFIGNWIHT